MNRALSPCVPLTFLLLLACRPSPELPARSLEERAADFDAAWDAMELDQAGQALTLLEALRAEDPLDPLVLASLGEIYRRLDRPTDASVALRLAVSLDPSVPQAARSLAALTALQGRMDEAVDWLDTALALGQCSANDLITDPALHPLLSDHRVVFFQSTGVLSRRDKELDASLEETEVEVGAELRLILRLTLLNQPLLTEPPTALVHLAHPLPPGFLQPLSRTESVQTGDAGGKQYLIRTVEFTFRALAAGSLRLGPFEATVGTELLQAPATALRIRQPRQLAWNTVEGSGEEKGTFGTNPSGQFIAFPSALKAPQEGARLEILPLGKGRYRVRGELSQAGSGAALKALHIEGWPHPMPPHGPEQQSALSQRSTLGLSWRRVELEIQAQGELGPLRLMQGDAELARANWDLN